MEAFHAVLARSDVANLPHDLIDAALVLTGEVAQNVECASSLAGIDRHAAAVLGLVRPTQFRLGVARPASGPPSIPCAYGLGLDDPHIGGDSRRCGGGSDMTI